MLLAGDIGGTKTLLALFDEGGDPRRPRRRRELRSQAYPDLDTMVREFLGEGEAVERACFAVAGPVIAGRTRPTNLPWLELDERDLAERLGVARVRLLNDLQAVALGVTALEPADVEPLLPGEAVPHAPVAVVAPGTGLGEAFLTWDGSRYVAHASEGGHADFAPRDAEQVALLAHLRPRLGHVSYEQVCSGIGIPALHDFLAATSGFVDPPDVAARLAAAVDPTRVIVAAGVNPAAPAPLCREAVRLFTAILGAEAANLAVKVLATGGVYLGGGLPPAVLPVLRSGPFAERFRDKGRMSHLLARVPVHVVASGAALVGAAIAGLQPG